MNYRKNRKKIKVFKDKLNNYQIEYNHKIPYIVNQKMDNKLKFKNNLN